MRELARWAFSAPKPIPIRGEARQLEERLWDLERASYGHGAQIQVLNTRLEQVYNLLGRVDRALETP